MRFARETEAENSTNESLVRDEVVGILIFERREAQGLSYHKL